MESTMSRFAPALRRVARELDLPRAVRAAILLEMAADLDAVYDHHRRAGVDEEEAARRAEETVLGSSEVIRRLGRLHRGSWRDWSESVGSRLAGGIDLVLLLVGVLPMLVLAAVVTAGALSTPMSPLLWLLVAVGLAIGCVLAVEGGRLLGGGRGAGRALPLLLVLSVTAPAIGLLALAFGVHATAVLMSTGSPDAAARIASLERVGRDGVLLLLGLLLGLTGALSWFVLLNRTAVRTAREVDALLADGATAVPHDGSRGIVPLVRRRKA
jgi:hypothetical protein